MLKFRKTAETDRKKLEEWIFADSDHRDRTSADFFLPQNDHHIQTFVMQDEEGDLFFVRGENLLRLHMQFAPPSEKNRLARGISEFTESIASGAAKTGYKQIIFESTFAPLIRFLKKRGFYSSPAEYLRDIR